jgi:phosphoenolpyruvate-protein phosphotransferase/dihydroxyacetone kinase phosphotransfer subunit
MVSIVVVAHSAALAEGTRQLALQVAQGKVRIVAAGGVADPENPIGTDAVRISSAIQSVYGDEGVLVIADLGSALLSTETAIEMLPAEMRGHVRLSAAPLVEGAVVAAVQAALGSPLDQVEAEARRALDAKALHLGVLLGGEATPLAHRVAASRQVELTVRNPLGLHARPAALFVATAARFPVAITVRNLTRSRGPADAKSINQLAILAVRQGDQVQVSAEGEGADRAIAALEALVAEDFGESEPVIPGSAARSSPRQPQPIHKEGPGHLAGIPASPGLALAPAFIYQRESYGVARAPASDPTEEMRRFEAALKSARSQLRQVRARSLEVAGPAEARIFDAQLLSLEDPELAGKARTRILEQRKQADAAWAEAVDSLVESYEALPDQPLRARATDIVDIGRRVSALLASAREKGQPEPAHPVIVVAVDLTPSDVAQFDPVLVRGVCTALGGSNSHSSILARAMGIPSVVGLGPEVLSIPAGAVLVVDGDAGEIRVQPTDEEQEVVRLQIETQATIHRAEEANSREPAVTRDGRRIAVYANAASVEEVREAVRCGAEGIGVLRTEYLFLDRETAPTEAEQVELYADVLEAAGSFPVVLRTLDAGGDKSLPYLRLAPEANPFLGRRGLRLSLAFPDLLKAQLRAAMRARRGGDVRILFPMVTTLQEVRDARRLLSDVVGELRRAGESDGTLPQVGIMAEVPAVAVLIDRFAREVQFVSIGSNDLAQYVLAAERGGESLTRLGEAYHPAVLRAIKTIADGCREAGTKVSVCGEMAAEPEAIPLLLGLGISELSMSPRAIPRAKAVVRSWSLTEARKVANRALQAESAEAVRELVRRR